MRKLLLVISLLIFSNLTFSQVFKSSNTQATLIQELIYGIKYDFLKITSEITNESTKTISRMHFKVVFRDKYASSYDLTAALQISDEEIDVNIPYNWTKTITLKVVPPKDIKMTYYKTTVERIVYSDGTYVDFN